VAGAAAAEVVVLVAVQGVLEAVLAVSEGRGEGRAGLAEVAEMAGAEVG
jgi:hypothetical protein